MRQEVIRQILRVKKRFASKSYCLEWSEWREHSVGAIFFAGNVNNGSDLDVLNNFILPQLQDFLNT